MRMNCKNCGNEIEGKFCSNCGQSAKVDKLNLQSFLSELADNVFQINKGLFFTIKELSLKPGHTIRNFLEGKRKNHFKPIAYVFLLSTIYILVSKFFDSPTLIEDFFAGASDNVQEEGSVEKFPIIEWLSNNYAYTTLLLIPIFSLASFLSFLGLKRNYLEHIVLNSYITGHQAILYSFSALVGQFFEHNGINVLIAFLTTVLFNFWTFIQFFNNEKKLLVIARLLLTYLLFYILFSIALAAIIIPFLEK
jgi:hypothetical protein